MDCWRAGPASGGHVPGHVRPLSPVRPRKRHMVYAPPLRTSGRGAVGHPLRSSADGPPSDSPQRPGVRGHRLQRRPTPPAACPHNRRGRTRPVPRRSTRRTMGLPPWPERQDNLVQANHPGFPSSHGSPGKVSAESPTALMSLDPVCHNSSYPSWESGSSGRLPPRGRGASRLDGGAATGIRCHHRSRARH
jgi:hypothetical protein